MPLRPIDVKTPVVNNQDSTRLRENQKTNDAGQGQFAAQQQQKGQEKFETVKNTDPAQGKVLRKEDEENEKKQSGENSSGDKNTKSEAGNEPANPEGAPKSAEDLTQKVFLKMIEQLPKYEPRGIPFAAWVFRVARNAWIDEDRTARPTVSLGLLTETAALTVGPHEAAVAAMESETLRTAVATLQPDQRDVIASRFFAGLSCRETAMQMGRSEGSVRVIQHRALAALRKRMPTFDGRLGDAGSANGAGPELSAR